MLDYFKKCLNADYVHTAESGDYAIEHESNTLYLLFQWSNGKEDWKHNFNFPAKPYKRMSVLWFCHRGFLEVWQAMKDEVEAKVAEYINQFPKINKIVCIGYSHGAAIATLATEDMEYIYGGELFISVSGYGFGCPRVLWGFIPKTIKARLASFVRITNIPDIVARVPPRWLLFRNIGTEIHVGKLGTYNSIDAHRPQNYITELTKWEGEGA